MAQYLSLDYHFNDLNHRYWYNYQLATECNDQVTLHSLEHFIADGLAKNLLTQEFDPVQRFRLRSKPRVLPKRFRTQYVPQKDPKYPIPVQLQALFQTRKQIVETTIPDLKLALNRYISSKGLQNVDHRTQVKLDKTLQKLIPSPCVNTFEITYTKLHKLIIQGLVPTPESKS